MGPVFYGG